MSDRREWFVKVDFKVTDGGKTTRLSLSDQVRVLFEQATGKWNCRLDYGHFKPVADYAPLSDAELRVLAKPLLEEYVKGRFPSLKSKISVISITWP